MLRVFSNIGITWILQFIAIYQVYLSKSQNGLKIRKLYENLFYFYLESSGFSALMFV